VEGIETKGQDAPPCLDRSDDGAGFAVGEEAVRLILSAAARGRSAESAGNLALSGLGEIEPVLPWRRICNLVTAAPGRCGL